MSIMSLPSDEMDHSPTASLMTEASEVMQVQTTDAGTQLPAGETGMTTHQYSTNPNTVRVRRRNANLSPYRRAVERARSNDQKAVAAAWKDRVTTETYQSASERKKEQILDEVQKEVMDRRRRKGIDADSKIRELNRLIDENVTPENFTGEGQPNMAVPPNAPSATTKAGVASATIHPSPHMAPPGYVPYPVQPIPELMESTKKQPALYSVPRTHTLCSAVPVSSAGATNAAAGGMQDGGVPMIKNSPSINATRATVLADAHDGGGPGSTGQPVSKRGLGLAAVCVELKNLQPMLNKMCIQQREIMNLLETHESNPIPLQPTPAFHEEIAKMDVEYKNGRYIISTIKLNDETMWKPVTNEEVEAEDLPRA